VRWALLEGHLRLVPRCSSSAAAFSFEIVQSGFSSFWLRSPVGHAKSGGGRLTASGIFKGTPRHEADADRHDRHPPRSPVITFWMWT
jgi:hypothetical protein